MPEQDPAAREPIIDAPTAAFSAPPALPAPENQTKDDLVERAAGLGLPATGTKADLVGAITDAEITGRPPLSLVGEQALADEEERTTRIYIDPDNPSTYTEV